MKLKLPDWIAAILIGFLILEVGTRMWSLFALANIKLTPSIPWSFLLMAGVLWLIWQYLQGKWKPVSTQERRKLWMRANKLDPQQGYWPWISAALLGITILLFIIISTRLIDFPSGQIDQVERISGYSNLMAISLMVMTSIVAGVMEEIACRGYMQKRLELTYGPRLAIFIVALFFSLLHLPNATIAPQLLIIFLVGSVGWGLLAYLTDSILPGILIHSLVDMIGYLWMWNNLSFAKSLASESILRDGLDTSFLILLLICICALLGLIFSFWRLAKMKNQGKIRQYTH